MARKKIEVKSTTIVGSSDYGRIKAKRAILEENHRKNASFFASIKERKSSTMKEPLPNTMVNVLICGKYLSMQYSIVKAAGYNNWKL